MSCQTRAPLPVSQQLLQPQVRSPPAVQRQLQLKWDMQKRFFDKSSKPLKSLARGQVVRLQTDKGHARLGHIHGPAKEPRLYLVEVDGVIYRRNHQHILPVKEPRPATPCPDAPRLVVNSHSRSSTPTTNCLPAPVGAWLAYVVSHRLCYHSLPWSLVPRKEVRLSPTARGLDGFVGHPLDMVILCNIPFICFATNVSLLLQKEM